MILPYIHIYFIFVQYYYNEVAILHMFSTNAVHTVKDIKKGYYGKLNRAFFKLRQYYTTDLYKNCVYLKDKKITKNKSNN